MKVNFVRPKDEPKPFQFKLEDICIRQERVWNSFSVTPKEGEKYGRYSFDDKMQKSNDR